MFKLKLEAITGKWKYEDRVWSWVFFFLYSFVKLRFQLRKGQVLWATARWRTARRCSWTNALSWGISKVRRIFLYGGHFITGDISQTFLTWNPIPEYIFVVNGASDGVVYFLSLSLSFHCGARIFHLHCVWPLSPRAWGGSFLLGLAAISVPCWEARVLLNPRG